MHIDTQNANIESIILGLSHFVGGQLWLQDGCGRVYDEIQGQLQPGSVHEISGRCYAVHTSLRWHRTLPWKEGDRLVLVAYTVGQYRSLSEEHCNILQSLGFGLPPRN